MAYVAVTKSLIDNVHHTINGLMTAEHNAMADPSKLIQEKSREQHILDLVVDELWKPEADLRPRLEKYSSNINVNVIVEQGEGVRFNFYANVQVPCFVDGDRYSTVQLKIAPEHLHNFTTCLDATAAKNEATTRWDAVRKQVVTFLETCKSVNEAIKLWPDVQRYLPKETMQKLGAKTEKQARDMSNVLEALKAIDMETINTSHVLARMAGAR